MRRGICGSSLNDLGLLSNFKSVRINILLKFFKTHTWNEGIYCIKDS